MRRALNTLTGRLALLQLLIYAALLPLLFSGLDTVVRTNTIDAFVRHARAYSGALARELELGGVLESPSRTIIFLDGSVEGGRCVYAAMELNGRLIGSSASDTPAWVRARGDDLQFGKSHDGIYAVAMQVRREDKTGTLYLGFDKRPTLEQLQSARDQIIEALAIYGVGSILVAVLLARLISRPLTQLQAASRRVARGEPLVQLGTDSNMIEIVELSHDLENMRTELVGTAQRLREEMQQRQVEQAERAVLESHLRHEQRLATVGTLAGGLAHEFNNILVPLILYAEEALEELDTEHPARSNLERVLKAANRAADVVSRLLAFSRPMTSREPEPVSLACIVDEALDLFQALIPPNIELIRDIDSMSAVVLGDATLLNQVVLNLCANAVQAMRERGGMLIVRVLGRLADSAVPTVELSVKDTGHGMSREIIERIFEPYFTTRDVGEGSGLGLSIAHSIVISMGGSIRVSSVSGEGAEFVVQLPALKQDLPVREAALATPS